GRAAAAARRAAAEGAFGSDRPPRGARGSARARGAPAGHGGGPPPLRPRPGAARSGDALAPGGEGPRAAPYLASHRCGRMVAGRALRGDRRALQRPRLRAGLTIASAPGPVRRLRRLAAGLVPGGRAAAATILLDEAT